MVKCMRFVNVDLTAFKSLESGEDFGLEGKLLSRKGLRRAGSWTHTVGYLWFLFQASGR